MSVEVKALEEEADWAYKYGQEARKAVELDWRLNSAIYDMGLMTGLLNKFIEKLGKDDKSWIDLIPNVLDQKFDLEDNVRNHLQRPVGSFAEQDRIHELQERIKEHIATRAEQEEYDNLTHDFMAECNKKVLQEYSDWQEAEMGFDSEENRSRHRTEWTLKIPKVFARLMANRGAPLPEELIRAVLGAKFSADSDSED